MATIGMNTAFVRDKALFLRDGDGNVTRAISASAVALLYYCPHNDNNTVVRVLVVGDHDYVCGSPFKSPTEAGAWIERAAAQLWG